MDRSQMDRSQEPFDRLESLGSSLTTDEGKGNLYSDLRTPNHIHTHIYIYTYTYIYI